MRQLWQRAAPALILWATLAAFTGLAFGVPLMFRGLCGPWATCPA